MPRLSQARLLVANVAETSESKIELSGKTAVMPNLNARLATIRCTHLNVAPDHSFGVGCGFGALGERGGGIPWNHSEYFAPKPRLFSHNAFCAQGVLGCSTISL